MKVYDIISVSEGKWFKFKSPKTKTPSTGPETPVEKPAWNSKGAKAPSVILRNGVWWLVIGYEFTSPISEYSDAVMHWKDELDKKNISLEQFKKNRQAEFWKLEYSVGLLIATWALRIPFGKLAWVCREFGKFKKWNSLIQFGELITTGNMAIQGAVMQWLNSPSGKKFFATILAVGAEDSITGLAADWLATPVLNLWDELKSYITKATGYKFDIDPDKYNPKDPNAGKPGSADAGSGSERNALSGSGAQPSPNTSLGVPGLRANPTADNPWNISRSN
jgi:hypothetical protein